jgi:hypothetical protein
VACGKHCGFCISSSVIIRSGKLDLRLKLAHLRAASLEKIRTEEAYL